MSEPDPRLRFLDELLAPGQYPITSICCVCDKLIGLKPGGTQPGVVSHGLCTDSECVELFKQGKKKLK